jgi:hypothetical protein
MFETMTATVVSPNCGYESPLNLKPFDVPRSTLQFQHTTIFLNQKLQAGAKKSTHS